MVGPKSAVIYALQKSVKVFYVQKMLSKFCPLVVTSTIRRCPTTVQKTRKTTNMVVFKVYQYQDLLKPEKYATKYESINEKQNQKTKRKYKFKLQKNS